MIDDAVLAREAHLIYQNAYGFEPENGNMMRWKGIVSDSVGKQVQLLLVIPPTFPKSAPEFFLPDDCKHPIADAKGKIVTRSLSRWKKDFHLFQVIREVRQAIVSASFDQVLTQAPTASSDDVLSRQLQYLKSDLTNKRDEFEKIKSAPVSHSMSQAGTQQAIAEVNDDALVNIQNELWALEDTYDGLEIDGIEFSKKFLKLQKRYYMISKSQ
ncbi:MAG: ubiquitin-conjugating enzyme E2 variant [Candidatus Kariarchaeaceae archaeon]|jgi:ubiquitin-protein ligase